MLEMLPFKHRTSSDTNKNPTNGTPRQENIGRSVISEDVVIEGRGISGPTLDFGGQLIGDLNVEELVISVTGTVTGNIKASVLKIAGKFDGSIIADDVTLTDTARVTGTIVAQTMTIERGAQVIGEICCKTGVQPKFPSASSLE